MINFAEKLKIKHSIKVKEKKGITLIALIVTIIVLLILAGVIINVLYGENGIFNNAHSAVILTEKGEIDEALKMSVMQISSDYLINWNERTLTSYFTNYIHYTDYTEFVKNANFALNLYPIVNYEVAGLNTDKYVDISLKKNNGTGRVYRYIIKLGKDINVETSTPDPDVEDLLPEMRLGEVSEINNTATIYQINYVLNGGTNPINAQNTYVAGRIQNFPIPKYEGYAFVGWYENSSFSGEKVTATKKQTRGDLTLYAKWIEETNSDYFTGDIATITGFSSLGINEYNNGNITNLVIPLQYNGTQYADKVGLDVEQIGNYAFQSYTDIHNLILGNNIKIIGDRSFSGCSGISNGNIEFPEGLEKIGKNAFDNCRNIKGDLVLSNNISIIDDSAFYNCTGITKLVLGEKITTVGERAFDSCNGITDLTIPISLNITHSYSSREPFIACENITNIHFTKGTGDVVHYTTVEMLSCTPWYKARDKELTITLEEGITALGNGMFYECTGLKNINFPDSLTIIGEYTFYKCTNLIKENLGRSDNFESIGKYAFYQCTSLTGELDLTGNIETINEYSFVECTGITKLIIGENITSVGMHAFDGCTGIIDLTIPISLNVSHGYSSHEPFIRCENITKIKFSKGNGVGIDYSNGSIGTTPWNKSTNKSQQIIFEKGIERIGNYTCNGMVNAVFYYTGSEEDWQNVTIGVNNNPLTTATINYNYAE